MYCTEIRCRANNHALTAKSFILKQEQDALVVNTLTGLYEQVKQNAVTVDNLARDKMKHSDQQEKAQRAAYKARTDLRNIIYMDRDSDVMGNFVDAAADVINAGIPKAKRVPVNLMQPGILRWMVVHNHNQTMRPLKPDWQESLRHFDKNFDGKSIAELKEKPYSFSKREIKLLQMLTVNMEVAVAGEELAKVFEGWARNLIVGSIASNESLAMLLNKAAQNKYDRNEKDKSLHTRLLEAKWYEIEFLEANKRYLQLHGASQAAIIAKRTNVANAAGTAIVARPRQPNKPNVPSKPRYNAFMGKSDKICNKDHKQNGCNRFRNGMCKYLHPRSEQMAKTGYQPVHSGYGRAQSQRYGPMQFGNPQQFGPPQQYAPPIQYAAQPQQPQQPQQQQQQRR